MKFKNTYFSSKFSTKYSLWRHQVAGAREMFLWLGSFYVIAGSGMLAGFARWGHYTTVQLPTSQQENILLARKHLLKSIQFTSPTLLTNGCYDYSYQNQEARCHRAPPAPHLRGWLPGGHGIWEQGEQDQGGGWEHPPVRARPHRHAGRPPQPRYYRRREDQSSGMLALPKPKSNHFTKEEEKYHATSRR